MRSEATPCSPAITGCIQSQDLALLDQIESSYLAAKQTQCRPTSAPGDSGAVALCLHLASMHHPDTGPLRPTTWPNSQTTPRNPPLRGCPMQLPPAWPSDGTPASQPPRKPHSMPSVIVTNTLSSSQQKTIMEAWGRTPSTKDTAGGSSWPDTTPADVNNDTAGTPQEDAAPPEDGPQYVQPATTNPGILLNTYVQWSVLCWMR